MVASRVKPQARDQNDWSIALKWGIVHLCGLSSFRDTTKNFCKKIVKSLSKISKVRKFKK